MKEFYNVRVSNESETYFREQYSQEEIKTILKFIHDMEINDVPHYDMPFVEFEKDGKTISVEDYYEYSNDDFKGRE